MRGPHTIHRNMYCGNIHNELPQSLTVLASQSMKVEREILSMNFNGVPVFLITCEALLYHGGHLSCLDDFVMTPFRHTVLQAVINDGLGCSPQATDHPGDRTLLLVSSECSVNTWEAYYTIAATRRP